MKHLRNRRGVALMMVLSSLTILTTMMVEFAYNTNVNYHLALNERDRLKATYLAKSAYHFMLLEMKFDRVFQQVVQQQNLGQYLGANAQLPLCQQFPLSTGLIRAVFTGGGLAGLLGGGEGEGEGDEQLEEMRRDVTMGQEDMAQEFLDFEGDFDGECVDEATKINLNGFAGLATTATTEGQMSPFDQYKQFLFRFLTRPEFADLFEAEDVSASDVITNIGDWVDDNTQINEFGGRGGGAESSLYERAEAPYKVHNGKLLTLLEAYLIEGVVDEWFAPMTKWFTVYGDAKINACTADTAIVESLIRRYVDTTPNLPPVRLEDPEEMQRLMDAILEACASGETGDALAQGIATALDGAIGAIGGGAEEQQGATRQTQAASGFAAYLATQPRYFGLTLTGQVIDTTVRIKAVVDVKEQDPKKWKLLYWRIY